MRKETTIYVELEKGLKIIAQDSVKYWTVWTKLKGMPDTTYIPYS